MPESNFIVQKVEWFQLRAPDGTPFFVMVSSLPNGYFTAVPCRVTMELAAHGNMGLGQSSEAAMEQLTQALAGKTLEQIFAHD
ncbi:MAG: hypothetical protein HY270_04020 [Deltaproteobacteria bacterium]|nr:hypothetical protein [Deltaproteobacteria bacterium]